MKINWCCVEANTQGCLTSVHNLISTLSLESTTLVVPLICNLLVSKMPRIVPIYDYR